MDGYEPEWRGPMQPLGEYTPKDLKRYFDRLIELGFQYDGDGNVDPKLEWGFYVVCDDAGYVNAQAEAHDIYFSGWMFDDFKVRKLVIGEEVWTQTVIIPGPLFPCETAEVQFEWEDVPFSNYKICITCCPDGACNNLENQTKCVQILAVTNLEFAHFKEVESNDMTEYTGDCVWEICSSDYDNYLSNAGDDCVYDSETNSVLNFAPVKLFGDEDCEDVECFGIPVDHLYQWVTTTLPSVDFTEDFSTGGPQPPAGWTNPDTDWACNWYGPFAIWYWNWAFGLVPAVLTSPTFDPTMPAGNPGSYFLSFYAEFSDSLNGCGLTYGEPGAFGDNFAIVEVFDGAVWQDVTPWPNPIHQGGFTGQTFNVNIPDMYINPNMQVRFVAIPDPIWGVIGDWYWVDTVQFTHSYNLYAYQIPHLFMNFTAWWDEEAGWDYVALEMCNGCPCDSYYDWFPVAVFTGCSEGSGAADDDGWVPVAINLAPYITGDEIALRFRSYSDENTEYRGFLVTNMTILNLFNQTEWCQEEFCDFEDDFDNLDNWCCENFFDGYGDYWEYNSMNNEWCIDVPLPALPINDELVWATEIADAYEAYFTFEQEHVFGTYALGYLEISADGGNQWFILDVFSGDSGGWIQADTYDLSFWAGQNILIRFRFWGGHSTYVSGGHWCVRDLVITGKIDDSDPNSTITMTGTMTDSGWYSTPVQCTIVATDVGAGMGEIHYILDGSETVVSGETATFTVSGNGAHNLEFWAVDLMGNEEMPHNTVPTFRIDSGSPPTVAITAPGPGLYLFGNKILDMAKPFIIGAFDVEATASDAESGIYKVSFFLDGDKLADDTEQPYGAYVCVKHMGAGTLKAIAEDFSGNTAEDTLDVTYYKFL
jgi:hypothetical protein